MSGRISIKPDVCNGRPVVRGTRIAVQTVLEFLAAGDSIEDVLEEYHNHMIAGNRLRDKHGKPGQRHLNAGSDKKQPARAPAATRGGACAPQA
jgi:hypothetical protein